MRSFCADICQATREPRHGTAPSAARSWLLVEHSGPWPAFGWPADVAHLMDEAMRHGVRPQLIRRPAERRRVPPYTAYLGWTTTGETWLERSDVGGIGELADALDLGALARGERTGFGALVAEPVLLVCTHGARDACCAIKGRPLATALTIHQADLVWETTHVGGDRFAANLVCLPHGTYFGGVGPADAAEVAGACLRGEVALSHYRGRAGVPAAVQAADYHARAATGVLGVDDVRAIGERPGPDETIQVDLEVVRRPLRVTVRPMSTDAAVLTSCTAGTVGTPVHYDLVAIDVSAGASSVTG